MDEKKPFELSDDALDSVAGGIGGPEHKYTKTCTCSGCYKTVSISVLQDDDIDGHFGVCPLCGHVNFDL